MDLTIELAFAKKTANSSDMKQCSAKVEEELKEVAVDVEQLRARLQLKDASVAGAAEAARGRVASPGRMRARSAPRAARHPT